jgi:hypothetical protein
MKTMQLHLDQLGCITKEYPRRFYRVSKWSNDLRVADFTTQSEAHAFAIKDAKETGCKYDHKVSTMNIG